MKKSYRIALLGSALTAATFFAGAPAQAACVVTPPATPVTGTVVCGTTLTTDTTYAGVSPSVSRNYEVDTSTTVFNGSVAPATAAITGFGLAFTNTVGGANALNVVNNGVIQINTGNTAASGGDDALSITAIGSTPVNYSGAGSITNNSTTGGGLQITSSGTGNITANVGGNVSTLGNDYAVRVDHNGTAGNIVITTAAGTTLRGGFGGVAAFIPNFNSGTISITNNAAVGSPIAALNTFNFGVVGQSSLDGAVTVINNGAVGLATDRAQSVGVYGAMFGTGSTQTLSVSGTGAVFSAAVGVQAINIGLGMTTVNYSGAVNSTGARGIDVRTSAPTAATSVTTGAGAVSATGVGGVGINVAGAASPATVTTGAGAVTGTDYGIQVATTGVQTINANGVTTGAIAGIHSNTTALRTINVGAAGNVTGTTQSILLANTGGAAVNNSGIIGAGATGLAINAASATAPITVTNNTGATINGRLTLGAGADLVTNAGTINTQGVSDFGAGADVLTNSGTYNTTAATTLLGLETLNNSGTLNANFGLTFDAGATALTNTGTLNSAGTIDFGAGVDSFANSGAGIFNLTASTTLAGLETFSNSGRINLNTFTLTGPAIAFTNTGTIDTNGSATLAGFTSLTNAGTIDLAAGTFTGPAAFTNNGTILADEGASTISGQTNFANSGTLDLQDGAVGDVLTINSAFVGSGGSNLLVDFDQTTSDRLVINGAASGSTRIDANYLGAGLINLNGVLVVDALSASANAFVLGAVGGNTSPLVDYSLVQNGGDFLLVSAPNASAFDPLALTNFGPSLWYQSADEVIAQTRLPAATVGASFWGQVYLSRDKYDNGSTQTLGNVGFDVDQNLRTKRRGIQLGVDYGFGGGRVGLTAGYARAKANDRGVGDVGLKASGWNLGVYGQFGGVTGFHGEFLAKHDRYNADFNNGAFDGVDTDVRANGVDGSLGYRFGLGGDATLDANAGVSFVRTKFDDVAAFGFGYDLGSVNSTRGRAGLRATFGGRMSPYIDGTVYREFRGDGRVALFDGANTYNLENDGKATWFRAEAGILPNPTGLMLAAWADLGDRKGLGARLGFRFGGDAVAAPPPPPPPPPPPVQVAPATQTCLDGSVILATDSCPLPPPPPPPPPPAPERG